MIRTLDVCLQGYPGNVQASVTYVLTDGSAKADTGYLRVIMEATADKVRHWHYNTALEGAQRLEV